MVSVQNCQPSLWSSGKPVSLVLGTEKRHKEMTLARKAKKGWGSQGSKMASSDLRGKPEATKQKSYDAIRVYWAPVLTRGKLHIALLTVPTSLKTISTESIMLPP